LKEYYRPPNHLNCIKSLLAKQVPFIHKNYSEDTDWALELASKNLLKSEKTISEIIYFYQYIKKN
jgi:hypothetical protein